MNVGTNMMAHVFKIFIGNDVVMIVALSWMVFCTFMLIALNLIGGEEK